MNIVLKSVILSVIFSIIIENGNFYIENDIFSDVEIGKEYNAAILELYKSGCLEGENGLYYPEDKLTYNEFFFYLFNIVGIEVVKYKSEEYSGVENCLRLYFQENMSKEKLATPIKKEDFFKYIQKIYNLKNIEELKKIGKFNKDNTINRGNSCIILKDLKDKEKASYNIDLSFYKDIKDITIKKVCNTEQDFEEIWTYMMVNKLTYFEIPIGEDVKKWSDERYVNAVKNSFYKALRTYPEFSSVFTQMHFKGKGNIDNMIFCFSLKNIDNLPEEQLRKEQKEFEEKGIEIVEELYRKNILTKDMSNKEKSQVLFAWVCDNVEYDFSITKRTGYTGLIEGKTICQGYVATYTYLCHLAGVPTLAVGGYSFDSEHIWNKVKEDGIIYYIDVTFGDSNNIQGTAKYNWFWKEEKDFPNHILDEFNEF